MGRSARARRLRQHPGKLPEGIVACVSDSYDVYNAVRNLWGGALRDKVFQRKGTLVIPPDSGEAVTVLEELFKLSATNSATK